MIHSKCCLEQRIVSERPFPTAESGAEGGSRRFYFFYFFLKLTVLKKSIRLSAAIVL